MFRFILIGILIISSTEATERIKQLFNVQSVQIKEINASTTQTNYGFVKVKESNIIDIVPRFGGYVEKLYADNIYKYIKKGDRLALVYSPQILKAKEDYLNSLGYKFGNANKSMINSTKRKLKLLGISTQEINRIKNKRVVSSFTTIYSPQSGYIFKKSINQGSSFSKKDTLFQIVDLSSVWVEAKIYQNEIKNLENITKFTIKAKGIDKVFEAKKEMLYPYINTKEATATLRLKLKNPNNILKIGMYITLTSSTPIVRKIVIPRNAVIRKNGKWYTFLATDFKGEYEPLEIKIKPLNSKLYEVISGLTTQDRVVTNALFMMDSDAQISQTY